MYDEKIFYDSDCLICFLIVDQCEILQKLFSKVIVPSIVQKEILSLRLNPRIKYNFQRLIQMNFVEVRTMKTHSVEHRIFLKILEKYSFV